MRKKAVSVVFALAITLIMSSLIFLPSISGAVASSISVTSTGTILPQSAAITPIKKAVFTNTGGFSSADAQFVADHFNLVMVDPFGTSGVSTVKSRNPNVKIVGYKDLIGMQTFYDDWATVNAHEDWFMHTAGGSRIQDPSWGWYLMDPANTAWQAYFVNYVNTKIATYNYDGVFLDDTWNSISAHGISVQSSDAASWHNDVLGFLQYIKANITSGKLVIINTDEWNASTYIAAVDGEMLEGFTHCEWEAVNTPGSRDPGLIIAMINKLARDSENGKIVWCDSGTIYSSNAAEMARMVKYCYASFLLGITGSSDSCWQFNSWGNADGAKGYYPIMDTTIGSPTNAYYSSQNVYMRDYSAGKVLFNPSSTSRTVSLGGTYRLLDGTMVSSVTLNAYSGEILLPGA